MINQWEIYILNVLWLNGHSRLTWFCHSCCCRGALCFWGQKWTDTVCFAQTSPGYNHRDLLLRLLLIPWLGHFTSCHSHRTHGFRDIPTPRVEGDRPSKMYLVTHYSIFALQYFTQDQLFCWQRYLSSVIWSVGYQHVNFVIWKQKCCRQQNTKYQRELTIYFNNTIEQSKIWRGGQLCHIEA